MTPPPRYPVYVISKGRGDVCLTAQFFLRDGVPFRLVVEPQEADEYAEHFDRDLLLVTPFSNLGQGSIPARNFVWQHAIESGAERHWIFDDNIKEIWRVHKGERLRCDAAPALRTAEDFTDRYENIAVSGFNYHFFVRGPTAVFFLNCHVYSSLLIRNDLPQRWRGRYNEDTDLCLQVLSDGWCTVLFNAFVIEKMQTMAMKGGNTTQLYQGDGRLKMARSLERMWPHVVSTERRFQRPQHVVKGAWRGFDTPLRLKEGTTLDDYATPNEYGLKLRAQSENVPDRLKPLLEDAE